MPNGTHLHQLIEAKLGRDLGQYVRIRLQEGLGWRYIATELRRETGQAVSHEALRTWFADEPAAVARRRRSAA